MAEMVLQTQCLVYVQEFGPLFNSYRCFKLLLRRDLESLRFGYAQSRAIVETRLCREHEKDKITSNMPSIRNNDARMDTRAKAGVRFCASVRIKPRSEPECLSL